MAMRTRWFPHSAGLLSMLLAGGLGSAVSACDDITAGQPGEDPGPPKLLRLIFQDDGRTFAIDLLDHTPAVACDDSNVCTAGALGYPGPSCQIPMGKTSGTCPDPLSDDCATLNNGDYFGMPFGWPSGSPPAYDSCVHSDGSTQATGNRPLYIGNGTFQFRIAFSKLLSPTIETVTTDPNTGAYGYKIADGLVDLVGPDGKSVMVAAPKDPSKITNGVGVPGGIFWDPQGTTDATSDPIGNVYGPAVVIKPGDQLSPSAKYTIKLDGTKLVDRKGQQAVDSTGAQLGAGYMIQFTVEDIAVLSATPDVTNPKTVLAPNDIVQFSMNSGVDETTANATLIRTDVMGCKADKDCGGVGKCMASMCNFPIDVFSDRGSDPTMCDAGLTDTTLDIIPVDKANDPTNAAVDLPEGAYTLSFTALKDDRFAMSGPFTQTFSFSVKNCAAASMMCLVDPKTMMPTIESDPAKDSQASANFLLPEKVAAGQGAATGHCENPPPPDGAKG
jgi:hypothetical protein